MENILIYFAIKYQGDWDKIYNAINKKEKVEKEDLDKVLSSNSSECITLINKDYPSRLKSIYKPPFVLFYKGDINLINSSNKIIGVVGSRKCSEYGENVTRKLVKDLVASNFVIVSGLAKGIDSIAHFSALDNGGATIAVLGNGINVNFPKENKDLQQKVANYGLIISEYPDFTEASKENFPKRNRIIAGLSDGVLVTEAKLKSGSMITVSRALEMGKDIFCVPERIEKNSGCNALIKEGAKLVETIEDILIEM